MKSLRCINCHRFIYKFGEIWRHYWSDSQFCTPPLSFLESHGKEATPHENAKPQEETE